MRIIILAEFAVPSGGAQKVALESARALADAGIAVTFVHAIGAEGDPMLDHPAIARVGLGLPDIWERPVLEAATAGVWNRAAARAVREVLACYAGEREVVLHLHQWTRAFSPSILPVLLSSGRPVAITVHDYALGCPNGVYYRFDKGEPCALTPLSTACIAAACDPQSRLHKLVRVLRTAAVAAGLKGRAIDLVHVSDRGRDTIAPMLPARMRHHRIDNPVSGERRSPAPIGPDAKIAYIGRLTREKGADLVARAARQADVPVLFVGEGPARAEIRDVHPGAEILGWRSPEAITALLQDGVRAVAAPSRWFETGPLTIYEAMASGVPTVVSSRAGAAEKVVDGVTGFVVEPDGDALAATFSRLRDVSLARSLGSAGYERYWRAPPTARAHAEALLALYGRMLGEATARRSERAIAEAAADAA